MTREVKVKASAVSDDVLKRLSMMYARLKDECRTLASSRNAGPKDWEDLMHDCIMTVAADRRAVQMDDVKLHEHFLYRFNMIMFQNIMDSRQENQHIYDYHADHKETAPED